MKCTHNRSRTIDSRKKGEYVYRRYSCDSCGHRWTTVEVVVEAKRGQNAIEQLQGKLTKQQSEAIINLINAFTPDTG